MSTHKLAFGGVICALASICIIVSCVFHVVFPLVISCVFYCICARKCGGVCAFIVVVTSNLIGFFIGGVGGGEILFSVFLFSPYSIIIYLTASLDKKVWQVVLRAIVFAVFSFGIYLLFATVFKELVEFDGTNFGMGTYLFGAVWTVVLTLFGFALDRGVALIGKRFIKND